MKIIVSVIVAALFYCPAVEAQDAVVIASSRAIYFDAPSSPVDSAAGRVVFRPGYHLRLELRTELTTKKKAIVRVVVDADREDDFRTVFEEKVAARKSSTTAEIYLGDPKRRKFRGIILLHPVGESPQKDPMFLSGFEIDLSSVEGGKKPPNR